MACAEAMAHGKPVVASAVGGLLDLVTHERTGLLVAPGDVNGLRAALERLLADRDLRRRLGEARTGSRRRVLLLGPRHGGDDGRLPRGAAAAGETSPGTGSAEGRMTSPPSTARSAPASCTADPANAHRQKASQGTPSTSV